MLSKIQPSSRCDTINAPGLLVLRFSGFLSAPMKHREVDLAGLRSKNFPVVKIRRSTGNGAVCVLGSAVPHALFGCLRRRRVARAGSTARVREHAGHSVSAACPSGSAALPLSCREEGNHPPAHDEL